MLYQYYIGSHLDNVSTRALDQPEATLFGRIVGFYFANHSVHEDSELILNYCFHLVSY